MDRHDLVDARMLAGREHGRALARRRTHASWPVVARFVGTLQPIGGDDTDFNPWSIVHDLRRAIDQAEVTEEWASVNNTTVPTFGDRRVPTKRKVDAGAVMRALDGLTADQVERVKRIYHDQEKTTLKDDLFEGGQSGKPANLKPDQRARIEVLLKGTGAARGEGVPDARLEADAIELHELLSGGLDETKRERVMTLHRRPAGEIEAIENHYANRYGNHPREDLNRRLNTLHLDRVAELRKGKFARADALAIEEKRRALAELQAKKDAGEIGILGVGQYEGKRRELIDGITGVLEMNRQEAMAEKTGPEAKAAINERINQILSTSHAEPNRTLKDELADTLKGTAAAGIVEAMSSGSLAETAARRLIEMEARDTTSASKIAELMRGLRKQGEYDALASLPDLPITQKQALLADPIAKREQLMTAHAKPYIEGFIRSYDELKPKDGRTWDQIVASADDENEEMLVAMRAGGGKMADVEELRFGIGKQDAATIKAVLRRQGSRERIKALEDAYKEDYGDDLRQLLFGLLGERSAMGLTPGVGYAGVVRGRDAAQVKEYLDAPGETELGGVKEIEHIAEYAELEVDVTEANSGAMGTVRGETDTRNMMNASAAQLRRLEAAWKASGGNPRLRQAILIEMRKVRATVTGDASAYEEENAQMVEQLRSAVSFVVQVALAFAIPGAGPGLAGFLANTALNIGATVASNIVIYGEQYNLSRLYGDVVGGGLGAVGGKLGEDLAKIVTGNATKGVARAAADSGMPALKLADQVEEAIAIGRRGSRAVKAIVEEGASIGGSTGFSSAATGENGFTWEAIIENVLMNRIPGLTGNGAANRPHGEAVRPPAAEGPAPPAGEGPPPAGAGGPLPGEAPPVPLPTGPVEARPVAGADPARTGGGVPAPGGSTGPGAAGPGGAARAAGAADRLEARGMWRAMEQVASEWTGMGEAGKRARLSDIANQLLAARDIPSVKVVPNPPDAGNLAQFDYQQWGIRIDPDLINQAALDPKAVAQLTELIRHEVEHGLQWWSMARLRASHGAGVDQIVGDTHGIDRQTAEAAFRSFKENGMSRAEQAAAQVWWDSVYSPTTKRNENLDHRKVYNERLAKLDAEIEAAERNGAPIDPAKLREREQVRQVASGFDALYHGLPEEIIAYEKGGVAGHEARMAQHDLEVEFAEIDVKHASDDLKTIENELKQIEAPYLEQIAAGQQADRALVRQHERKVSQQNRQIERLEMLHGKLEAARAARDAAAGSGGGAPAAPLATPAGASPPRAPAETDKPAGPTMPGASKKLTPDQIAGEGGRAQDTSAGPVEPPPEAKSPSKEKPDTSPAAKPDAPHAPRTDTTPPSRETQQQSEQARQQAEQRQQQEQVQPRQQHEQRHQQQQAKVGSDERLAKGQPTRGEEAVVQEYTRGLVKLRERQEILNRAQAATPRDQRKVDSARQAVATAERELDTIEAKATRDTGELLEHLDPYIQARTWLPAVRQNDPSFTRRPCEAISNAPKDIRGKDFVEIYNHMLEVPGNPKMEIEAANQAPGASLPEAHQRLTWEFADGSKLIVDLPRERGGRPASADLPHVEIHGPRDERLDPQGIVIPERSISSHLTITDTRRTLWHIFGQGRGAPE